MNYASPEWSPVLSQSNLDLIQQIQNPALHCITGCHCSISIQHLYSERKIPLIKIHLDMIGRKLFSCINATQNNPSIYLLNPHPSCCLKKKRSNSSSLFYQIFNTILPHHKDLYMTQHIQSSSRYLLDLTSKPIPKGPPPSALKYITCRGA